MLNDLDLGGSKLDFFGGVGSMVHLFLHPLLSYILEGCTCAPVLHFVGHTVGFANRDICATLMKSAIFDCKNERPQISKVTVFRPDHLNKNI